MGQTLISHGVKGVKVVSDRMSVRKKGKHMRICRSCTCESVGRGRDRHNSVTRRTLRVIGDRITPCNRKVQAQKRRSSSQCLATERNWGEKARSGGYVLGVL